MRFSNIIGQEHLKSHLMSTIDRGRIAHAQLFVGPEGSGSLPLAIAYAQHIICHESNDPVTSNNKCDALMHPDLHFVFPVTNSDKVKSHAVSDHYIDEWRQFVKEQPYGNLFDWYRLIGIEKKQGQIGVDEAQEMVKKLSLKSYEGGYKAMVVWMAEKLNTSAANKLLKLIEEPPEKTVLILIAEDETQLIKTIRSRCQTLRLPPLPESEIVNALLAKKVPDGEAYSIAHQANGNFNLALDLLQNDAEDLFFEKWFVQWVRSAFKAKGNKGAIHELILWSDEVSKTGRETQKKFLDFCSRIIRQALFINYGVNDLVFFKVHIEGFQLEKFAPFVHENNVQAITDELEKAAYHIERNGNAKIIFTDLSIKLTRLLHRKAA
ncbi:MAG: DNA polymerase III subunit delta' [Bacteroidota bacterium]